jgi:hypothetical protein
MWPRTTCRRAYQWPKFGKLTIASRPDAQHLAQDALGVVHAWRVCERITYSKDWSAKSERPLSRSTWSTLTSFATQARTLSSSISTP